MNSSRRKMILIIAAFVCCILCVGSIFILAKSEEKSIAEFYSKIMETKKHTIVQNNTKSDDEDYDYDEEETTGSNMIKGSFDKFVFVGDSRYRGMMFLAQENDVFICENGRGYDFLLEQMSYIKSQCDENTALIIGLGVNDSHYNSDKYINTLSEMADTMDCQIYYMLINPVDEIKEEYNGYHVLNENINYFNDRMREELDERIGLIDTNSYLFSIGFETMDGLHYTNDTYEDIYHFIKNEITE